MTPPGSAAPAAPTQEQLAAFWGDFTAATGAVDEPQEVFCFGDTVEMADGLARLVLEGPKRATAGLLADYEDEGTDPPAVGRHSVFHWGDGRPAGVILTTDVRVGPLSSVDARFAWDEGEGDRTLAYWVDVHERFFRGRCQALGLEFRSDVTVVFERFDLVWPV